MKKEHRVVFSIILVPIGFFAIWTIRYAFLGDDDKSTILKQIQKGYSQNEMFDTSRSYINSLPILFQDIAKRKTKTIKYLVEIEGYSLQDAYKKALWGNANNYRLAKKIKYTLPGQIFDRTGLEENAFLSYNISGNTIEISDSTESRSNKHIFSSYSGYQSTNGILNTFGDSLYNTNKTSLPNFGFDIYLTLDSRLQRILHEEFRIQNPLLEEIGYTARKGAGVILNAKNGNVLALVSSPDISDDNIFSQKKLIDYFEPFWMKFSNSTFPIGSTAKPLVATVALSFSDSYKNYRISPRQATKYPIPQKILDINRNENQENRIGLYNATAKSLNYYFCSITSDLFEKNKTDEVIQRLRKILGFNDILSWQGNRNPFKIADSKIFTENAGFNYWPSHLAIGNNDALIFSPLHLSLVYAQFLNGGIIFHPKLEEKVPPSIHTDNTAYKKAFLTIKDVLYQSVLNKKSTVRGFKPIMDKFKGLKIGAKTGTNSRADSTQINLLENLSLQSEVPGLEIVEQYYSWAIAIIEYKGMQLVIAIVFEDAVKMNQNRNDKTNTVLNETGMVLCVPKLGSVIYKMAEIL